MATTKKIEIELTPKELAQQLWEMDSGEQAVFFKELLNEAGNSHYLMLQFLGCRDECEKDPMALEAFQTMFSSAYKYIF